MDLEYAGILQRDKTHHVMMAKQKKPILDSNSKHHSSKGLYYSYGNRCHVVACIILAVIGAMLLIVLLLFTPLKVK